MITTRFAPSPTGFLHIGGLRTALYNYLFARKNGGKFLLRIEDTDLKRNSQEAVIAIREAFNWCGLDYDGDVEYQSKRFDIYKKYINQLLESGKAYKCYTTQEELAQMRAEAEAKKLRPKYDGRYRDFTGTPPQGIEPVIRIKAPLEGVIEFKDGAKGDVKFNCSDILDDFIIARSDGSPTYNFCVVIDDALMGVTHIIRGDDHLSDAPRHSILYEALEIKIPEFFHVAMINGSDGAKLSKRHGATDVMEYKDMGYLPEALLNFLVRLGWSHGDDEIFNLHQMIELFDPYNLSKSASTYNQSKLEWLNSHYIKSLPFERLADDMLYFGLDFRAIDKGHMLLDLLRERSKTLLELKNSALAIINRPTTYDPNAIKKFITDSNKILLDEFAKSLEFKEMDAKAIEEMTNEFLAKKDRKLKDLAQPIRIAITGSAVSPSIFEVIEIIGIDELKSRIQNFLKSL